MSNQQEREIEEGEIVEEDILVDDDELSEEDGSGSDVSDEELEMVYDDDDDLPDVTDLLGSALMTPDGDTVCSALCAIAQAMDMQNKILIKILSKLS